MLELATSGFWSPIADFVIYLILPFMLLLAFCITIHEFGHFLFAKIFGIPVEKFSIGYGPPLIRVKIGETDFRIAYFPLGGYIKMAGEDEGKILKHENEPLPEPKTKLPREEKAGFYDAPIYKRIIVVSAGPMFNIISAIIVMAFTFSILGIAVDYSTTIEVEENGYAAQVGFMSGDSVISANDIPINNWDEFIEILAKNIDGEIIVSIIRDGEEITRALRVVPDSLGFTNFVEPRAGAVKKGGPAHKAGITAGDRILTIDGCDVQSWTEMVNIVRNSKKPELLFEWEHNGETKTAYIAPESDYDFLLNDTIRKVDILKPHRRQFISILRALRLSFTRTHNLIVLTLDMLYQMITGKISRKALGGPIAIAKLSRESAKWGFEFLLGLLAVISVNLGIVNLFPIPALDGGHILIGTIEAVRRKRFSKKTILIMQQIGYAFILLLILFVTFNDITR